MGRFNLPPSRPLEDDKEIGEEEEAEGEPDTGVVTSRWAHVPKDMEQPEPEFLAKRRKGLPSLYGAAAGSGVVNGSMRKIKVKKVDADGNTTVWDVLAPEGAVVEGEIDEGEEIMTEAPAPGTVVEGVGVANADGVVIAGEQVMPAPARRRPPPPKRKPKGPGRGRKKKVVIESEGRPTGVSTDLDPTKTDNPQPTSEGLKVPENDGDRAQSDESGLQEGEEGSEEDDDDGDDGEDGDREEGEISDQDGATPRSESPSKSSSKPPPGIIEPSSVPKPALYDSATPQPSNSTRIESAKEPSSSPDLPLAASQPLPHPGEDSSPRPESSAEIQPFLETGTISVSKDLDATVLDRATTTTEDNAPAAPQKSEAELNQTFDGATQLPVQPIPSASWENGTKEILSEDPPIKQTQEGQDLVTKPVSQDEPSPQDPGTPKASVPGSPSDISTKALAEPVSDPTSISAPVPSDEQQPTTAPKPVTSLALSPNQVSPSGSTSTNLPDTEPIPAADAVTVEEAPQASEVTKPDEDKAEITLPEEHNPLEGFTEPRMEDVLQADDFKAQGDTAENQFTGEAPGADQPAQPEKSSPDEDIFGTLERHLDGKSK